jgi:hypothetical protein
MEQIKLGDEAKDRISGFVGIVVADTTWLNKCRRLTIHSRDMKDGRPIDSCTFDEDDVLYVGPGVNEVVKQPTGGPPSRGADPQR